MEIIKNRKESKKFLNIDLCGKKETNKREKENTLINRSSIITDIINNKKLMIIINLLIIIPIYSLFLIRFKKYYIIKNDNKMIKNDKA